MRLKGARSKDCYGRFVFMINELAAIEILKYALAQPKATRINLITVDDLVKWAAPSITSCPNCGAEPWVSIDCLICVVMSRIVK